MPFSDHSNVALREPECIAYEMSSSALTEKIYEPGCSKTGNSGVIDMDAEIAAALYSSGDDSDIIDLDMIGESDIPKPIVVCSSFSQANVLNDNWNNSERWQSRSKSRQCRSRSPQSKCDSNRSLTEKHQCPCSKCNTKNSSVIGSHSNIDKERPQEQQGLSPSLSLNVPLITSTLPYEKSVVNENKSIVLETRKQDMSVCQSSESAVQPQEQYCITNQEVLQLENSKTSESLVKENKTLFQKNQSDLGLLNVDANNQKGVEKEKTHDQCADGKTKWLKNKGHENLNQDSSVVDHTTESIDSDTDVSDVLHDQLVNTTEMQVRLVGSLEQQRQMRRMRLADSRSKIHLGSHREDFEALPKTNLKSSPTSVTAQRNLTSEVTLTRSDESVYPITDTHIIDHQLMTRHSQAGELQSPLEEEFSSAGEFQPPSNEELFSAGEHQVQSVEELPLAGECQSPSEEELSLVGECQPSSEEQLSPAGECRSLMVEHQSPIVDHQSLTVEHQLLTMKCQSPLVDSYRLPSVDRQPVKKDHLGTMNKIQIGLRSHIPVKVKSETLIETKKHSPIVSRSEIPMMMTTPLQIGHCTLYLKKNTIIQNLTSNCAFPQTTEKVQLQADTNEVVDGIAECHARTYVPEKEKPSAGPKKIGKMVPCVKGANQLTPECYIGNTESQYQSQVSNNWCNAVYYKDSTHNNHLTKNKQNASNQNIRRGNTTIPIVDYENLMTGNNESPKDINFEHIYVNSANKYCQANQQRLINSNNGSSTSIAYALRSIHLTIIGDPEDNGDAISVAGTGKLAAALCRADGLVTVLPYRQHRMENVEEIPGEQIPDTCPLQLLGEVGPAGRRARLDVIER